MRHSSRYLLLAALVVSSLLPLRAQWDVGFGLGVAWPGAHSADAPELRRGTLGTLRVERRLAAHPRWLLVAEVGGLKQSGYDSPDFKASPIDTFLYVNYFQFYPLVVGAAYELPVCDWLALRLHGSLGAHYHDMAIYKQTRPNVIRQYDEKGFGFALKGGVEAKAWQKVSLAVNVWWMGNPFKDDGDVMPGVQAAKRVVFYNHRDYSLRNYGQLFLVASLNYWIDF